MMKKGLVSVVTPCYNGEKFVRNLLDSLLSQTYKKLEVIFVDDGSVDNTAEIVKGYEEQFSALHIPFRYIYQKNQGQAAALNNGLQYVNGEYLVWPDSDDYYEDDGIENLVYFLIKHKDYNAVRGECVFRKNDSTKEILEHRKSCNSKNTDLFLNYITEEDTYFYTGIIMVRTEEFFKKNKGRDIYINRAGQNWQIILPSFYHSKVGYVNKIVYNVLVREDSHSRTQPSRFAVLKRFQNHRKILNKTVKKIVDDKEERKKYLKIIKEKYNQREREYIKWRVKHWNEN